MKWFSRRCQALAVTLGHALLSRWRLSFNDIQHGFRLFPHRKHGGDAPSCKHCGRKRWRLIWVCYLLLAWDPLDLIKGFLPPVLLAGLLSCHHPYCFREYERNTERLTIADQSSISQFVNQIFIFSCCWYISLQRALCSAVLCCAGCMYYWLGLPALPSCCWCLSFLNCFRDLSLFT